MNTEINYKRQSFRLQIVSKQKEQLFRKHRLRNLQLKTSPIQHQEESYQSCALQIEKGINVEKNFAIINDALSSNNIFRVAHALLQIDYHLVLMNNLKKRQYLYETLTTLSLIIESPKLEIGHYFVRQGLLDYLVSFLKNNEFSFYCCGILGNLSIQCNDNGQILLSQGIHHLFFSILKANVLDCFVDEEKQQLARSIIRLLVILTEIAQKSNIDYRTQIMDLLSFCEQIYLKGLECESLLEIIYFSALAFPEETHFKVKALLNELLANTTVKGSYVKNLLYVCSHLFQFGLNYEQIHRICVQIPQYLHHCVRIMKKMALNNKFHFMLPKNVIWWEKLCQFATLEEDKKTILEILIKIQYVIEETWMMEFISTFLKTKEELIKQKQGLDYIYLFLLRVQKKEKALYLIESHGIHMDIQLLYESENTKISQLAEKVLDRLRH